MPRLEDRPVQFTVEPLDAEPGLDVLAGTSRAERAGLLRAVADALESDRQNLVQTAELYDIIRSECRDESNGLPFDVPLGAARK